MNANERVGDRTRTRRVDRPDDDAMPGAGVARVGFIGAGQMGRPMVDRMVAAGVPVTVFARRPEHRDDLEAGGISTTDSAAEVAAWAEVLIVCVFNDSQVREVMVDDGALAAMSPGAILVNHVTGSPTLPLELQDSAPDGVTVLDVPISGTDDHIRRGELTLMVGGDLDVLDRVRSVFATYCDPVLHVGGLGDGQRIKLVNNLVFAVNLRTAVLAAELAASMGVAAGELARVVSDCSGASFALALLEHASARALAEGARPYLVKDIQTVRDVAAEHDLSLGELGELAGWVFAANVDSE